MTDGQNPYVMHVRSDGHPVLGQSFLCRLRRRDPTSPCAASSGVFLAGTYRGKSSLPNISLCFLPPRQRIHRPLGYTRQTSMDTTTHRHHRHFSRTPTKSCTNLQGIALLGDFQGDIQLPSAISPNHKAQSDRDMFLATLNPQGRWRSFRTLHGSHAQTAQGRLLAQPDGSFVLSGTTNSPTLVWADSRFPTPQNNPTQTVVFLLHTERLLP